MKTRRDRFFVYRRHHTAHVVVIIFVIFDFVEVKFRYRVRCCNSTYVGAMSCFGAIRACFCALLGGGGPKRLKVMVPSALIIGVLAGMREG